MRAITIANEANSLRIANLHPLTNEQLKNRATLVVKLEETGYEVVSKADAWLHVAKDGTDTVVQLEIDQRNSMLDIVLLSDKTEEIGNGFPLGGSWAIKSSAFLTEDNLDFAVEKIGVFFDDFDKGNPYWIELNDTIKSGLRYESSMRSR